MKNLISKIIVLITVLLVVCNLSTTVQASTSDGSGPWADEVISSSQGLTKNGDPVPTVRSDPQAAVGVAEDNTADGTFFSLGFDGSITLRFDNGISSGVFVVEATNPDYPLEKANVQISEDGTYWSDPVEVVQDGSVSMPEGMSCASYVRITDVSDPNDFGEDTADAYDVDGVKAEGESCEPDPTPTPTPVDGGGDSGGSSDDGDDDNPAPTCGAQKPSTPTITSATKTSSTTVELVWTAVTPVTHYSIAYGTSPGSYPYGVPNTGNTTSFSIGGLDSNATYYFVVRAVNDCEPSDVSGEVSPGGQVLGASTGQVLGASTDTLAAAGVDKYHNRLMLSVLSGILTLLLGKNLFQKNE